MTVTRSIIAKNTAGGGGPDLVGAFVSGGDNLLGALNGSTGFTDGVNSDLAGVPDYVVTGRFDTYFSDDDDTALSLREAVDLANNSSGHDTIYVPAWDFRLTDTSLGNLDVTDHLDVIGIDDNETNIDSTLVNDEVFDIDQGVDFLYDRLTLIEP